MWFYQHIQPQIWSTIVIVIILCIFSVCIGHKIDKMNPNDKAPRLIAAIEYLVSIINNFTKETIGPRWKSYAPYILSLVLFLIFANLWGLTGMVPPTSSWCVTLALGFISWFLVIYTAIKSNGLVGYLKSFFKPLFFLLPVNIISELVLPFSLSLRLFGNILSGAVMGKLIYGLGGWFAVFFTPVFHAIFDVFFGLIQVLVFVLLTVVFIGQKVDPKEFEENAEEKIVIQEEM